MMVAKPADINQSDFLLVYHRRIFFPLPCFAGAYHLTQLLSRFWSLKKKLDYGQMYVSEIHRHIPEARRGKKILSPQKWTQDVMIVAFQNEPLNSTLMLEIRSLRQLSLVFRDAWLCEPEIKIQSDIIRQKRHLSWLQHLLSVNSF